MLVIPSFKLKLSAIVQKIRESAAKCFADQSAAMLLIVEGREEAVAALLRSGQLDPNARCGATGYSAAMVAVVHGRAGCLRALLDGGADDLESERTRRTPSAHPRCSMTLVALAISSRALECLRVLLACGARVDSASTLARPGTMERVPPTALHLAVEEKYPEGVALLLASGRVDVHAVWGGKKSVIQRAYDVRCAACLKLVVAAGADVGSVKLEKLFFPTNIAVLIEAGCADAEDCFGSTPLRVVSGWRDGRPCVRLLKKAGIKSLE